MKKKILLIAIIIMAILGCRVNKYYGLAPYIEPTKSETKIVFDDSYEYYIREVFTTKDASGQKIQKSIRTGSPSEKLIEVEWLLISKKDHNVIYFSTRPDKYQTYYLPGENKYLGDRVINIYDLKKLSLGTNEKSDAFRFVSKDDITTTDTWNVKYSGDRITIETVEHFEKGLFTDLIPVARALESDVFFRKVSNYEIRFYRNDDQTVNVKCVDNTVYLTDDGKGHQFYFKFDGAPTEVYFDNDRLAYSPEPLKKSN